MRDGILAAFSEFNNTSAYAGYANLRLVTEDDGYEPSRTVVNTERFLADGVLGLLGYVGTPTTNAIIPLVSASGVPLVGSFTGAASLRTPMNRMIFNVRASYSEEAEALVSVLRQFDANSVAIFYQDDAYGETVRSSMIEAMGKIGSKPSIQVSIPRNSVEITAAVKALVQAQPSCIVMASVYAVSARLITAMRASGSQASFASVSFVGTTPLLQALGDQHLGGVAICEVVPSPFNGRRRVVAEYQAAIAAVGTKASYGSLEGYLTGRLIAEAVRRMRGDYSRASLIRALETIDIDFGGFSLKFSPTRRNGSSFTEIALLKQIASQKS